ncbi:ArsC family transcriptional regulator [Candidatus Marinamargulisbacteria bacterium SCGC AG-343-D04]|nr:ArsC family transcriptional regulator [Candidatus Marinamargulisbacteria bacterium SCGC AG-343-D04]
MVKLYVYKKCSTCIKAIKFLESKRIQFEIIPIRDCPPQIEELSLLLTKGKYSLKQLFNVSGKEYRSLNMKEVLPSLSEDEALVLLSKNGNLVKRPVLISNQHLLVGFDEDIWKEHF